MCRAASIVLGGGAPVPWRASEAEQALVDRSVTAERANEAARAAVGGARALSKNAYKIPLTRGVIERTLVQLVGVG